VFGVYSNQGDFACVPGAEGVAAFPLVVPVDVMNDEHRFVIPASLRFVGYTGECKGMMTEKELGLMVKDRGI
jgi:hypothetical protein